MAIGDQERLGGLDQIAEQWKCVPGERRAGEAGQRACTARRVTGLSSPGECGSCGKAGVETGAGVTFQSIRPQT